ncbi:MAG: PqqD family protein [Candidatus Omnitrophica bacterium]|nr:PqqD family protein [Candidatus Omnitrophota bacterium]
MNFLEKRYQKSPDVVFRKIADEMILVPIRNNVGDLESIYTLNEIAARIWEVIDKKDVQSIKEMLLNEFDIDEKSVEKDLIDFLTDLEKMGFIIAAN